MKELTDKLNRVLHMHQPLNCFYTVFRVIFSTSASTQKRVFSVFVDRVANLNQNFKEFESKSSAATRKKFSKKPKEHKKSTVTKAVLLKVRLPQRNALIKKSEHETGFREKKINFNSDGFGLCEGHFVSF